MGKNRALIITDTTWREVTDAAKAVRDGLVEDQLQEPVRVKLNAKRGVTNAQAETLRGLLQKAIWPDPDAAAQFEAFLDVWFGRAPSIIGLSVSYDQGTAIIRPDTSLLAINRALTVTADWDDGSMESVPVADRSVSGVLTEGVCHLTVNYAGMSAGFDVVVTPYPVAVGISAVYYLGGDIQPGDPLDGLRPYLQVARHNDDGSSETVTGYTLSGALEPGVNIITAHYLGFATTFAVPVAVSLVRIEAEYVQGATVIRPDTPLDELKEGLTVTAYTDDGDSVTVAPADYSLSGELAAGSSIVTVSYQGRTDTFAVEVTPYAELEGITAVYVQAGTVYDNADLDDLRDGLTVTALYSDGEEEEVSEYILSGTLRAGISTVTVEYGGKSTTFTVTVTRLVYGYDTVGTPDIRDGILYPTDANYIKSMRPFEPAGPWKAWLPYKQYTVRSAYVIRTADSEGAGRRSLACQTFYSDNNLRAGVYLSSNGESWNIMTNREGLRFDYLSANTAYLIEVEFTGTAYVVRLSTDRGETWSESYTVQSDVKILGGVLHFGVMGTGTTEEADEIDLSLVKVWDNGALWWSAEEG